MQRRLAAVEAILNQGDPGQRLGLARKSRAQLSDDELIGRLETCLAAELLALLPGLLEQAGAAYDEGRFADAEAMIQRAGAVRAPPYPGRVPPERAAAGPVPRLPRWAGAARG